MDKLVIWSLFDSGNSCYKKAIEKYYPEIENYSIGLDFENKNTGIIMCDLSDMSELFGENRMFKTLDNLPKPDIILASPPCESFSNASAMLAGNVCWYKTNDENPFTVRTRNQLATRDHTPFKKYWWKTVYNRLNGEACIHNTIRIIEKYAPKVWVIENPQSSKIWNYLEIVQDFHGYKNLAYYYCYDENFSKKPTLFYSNLELNLLKFICESKVYISGKNNGKKGRILRSYNEKSNIPERLIKDILRQILDKISCY